MLYTKKLLLYLQAEAYLCKKSKETLKESISMKNNMTKSYLQRAYEFRNYIRNIPKDQKSKWGINLKNI